VDSRRRRSPPDRASAVPMDKPGKTQCVSPTLPTDRRLPNKLHSTPQQHGMILISGNGEISSRLHAFSLFLPESCPNNRDHRRPWPTVSWDEPYMGEESITVPPAAKKAPLSQENAGGDDMRP